MTFLAIEFGIQTYCCRYLGCSIIHFDQRYCMIQYNVVVVPKGPPYPA